ncbi:peptidoglycan editing factor PgeF [Halorhodospira sp. 9621]|uniref:peptidoglycan editing factor PgeF n=2 Tax=Ectothiorhodospiraceae TaxID=72276 RepID=UPI00191141FB|nr:MULTISPECIES: peptidoglycan editing factor PgeF [Halorhodospira]MBK5935675.1 multi-copper polyphenol oxidoreductase [Halorhodospira halophila]MCG5527311.1 peptidoglycan editing factor PgeF [Halorhodospira halophila]MCG5532462.1 peptidoglycan editing factor PgeF [Halorhodospira sp. 9621]MCG5543695.1 peptidoglycan editing factor PgeF [Halorhodospira sp. 9628]
MDEVDGGLFFTPRWPAPEGVRALSTLRCGGCSAAPRDSLNLAEHTGDDPSAVAANRHLLRTRAGLPAEPVWLEQVHGTEVVAAHRVAPGARADAAWTDRAGVVCAVLTADCLPVLLAAGDGRAVAAAHAGWRGLAAGILEAVVAALPVPAGELHAWLGPAIGPDAFEVGPEVAEALRARDPAAAEGLTPAAGDRWYADLYSLARSRLRQAGVTSVHGGGWCTHTDRARFFSHRRDGSTGRMASLIYREEP